MTCPAPGIAIAAEPRPLPAWLAAISIDTPPGDVPLPAWHRFVDKARILISDWLPQAEALGWTALDLFGCHPVKPHARIDVAGLAWFIGDGHVVAITAASAVIEAPSGSRLTFRRRRPRDPVVMPGSLMMPAAAR